MSRAKPLCLLDAIPAAVAEHATQYMSHKDLVVLSELCSKQSAFKIVHTLADHAATWRQRAMTRWSERTLYLTA